MKHLAIAIALTVSMSACGSDNPISATAPIASATTGTLSGQVFAITPSGLTALEGALVRVEIGSVRSDARTNPNGAYQLSGLPTGNATVTTTSVGYDTDTRTQILTGDVKLDIQVVPRILRRISGTVFELVPSGRVPVAGVYVTGSWDYPVFTDGNGSFSLAACGDIPCAFYNGDLVRLSLSKDAYVSVVKEIKVDGDMVLEVELIRR
jgi:hypothetical protein